MTYDEWEADVPDEIRSDTAWRVKADRLGLFLSDLSWHDVTKLAEDRRTMSIADQLFRAAWNISSNVIEGYSRNTGKDRARFYEYALGSARECRDWYYKGRRLLTPSVVEHRLGLCSEITKLTLCMVSEERRTNRRIAGT